MPSERRAAFDVGMMEMSCLSSHLSVSAVATLVVHALFGVYFRQLIGSHAGSTAVFVRCWLDYGATVEGMDIDLYSEQKRKASFDTAIGRNCRRRCWMIETHYEEVVEGGVVEEAYCRDAADSLGLGHGNDLGEAAVGI